MPTIFGRLFTKENVSLENLDFVNCKSKSTLVQRTKQEQEKTNRAPGTAADRANSKMTLARLNFVTTESFFSGE